MLISKRNRKGVLILAALLLVIIYTPRILASISGGDGLQLSLSELDHKELEIKEARQLSRESSSKKKQRKFNAPAKAFDPNDYTREDWVKLGLSEKQAQVVMKFSTYGIRSNDELKKIFVIPAELYEIIKDSTFYPSVAVSPKVGEEYESYSEVLKPVDLNTASKEELTELKGIGDYFAGKMIEYREKLGGYVAKEQLLEIWKFTPEKLDAIKENIVFSGAPKKLNVNSATYEVLVKHPYIDSKVANSIVKMRDQKGKYNSLNELLESKLIDEELFEKLEPYIKL